MKRYTITEELYPEDYWESAGGDWCKWEDVEACLADWQLMRVAMLTFVERCEKREVRSKKTYKQFKSILENLNVND